jgi:hypothetical protein
MTFRRLRPGLLLGLLVFCLTGCIWTRLLSFKNQLADFDRYVKVEDRDGLTLHFIKPVLYSGDIQFLMKLDPTRRVTNSTLQTWFWTFRKLPPPGVHETNNYDLSFSTTFGTNYFISFTLSERFLASIPKPVILGAMRSFGKAEIDTKKQSATMTWAGAESDRKDWHGLNRAAVDQLLGAPWNVTGTNGVSTLLYRYQLESPSLVNTSILARVRFSFSDDTGKLKKVDGNYAGMRINYEPDKVEAGEPRFQKRERKIGAGPGNARN